MSNLGRISRRPRCSQARPQSHRLHACKALEPRDLLDSTVVFSELMYHPAGDERLEWIKLHNEMTVNMDISDWSLDGINYRFPTGTVMPAGSYLVVASNPDLLKTTTQFVTMLGPYSGRLNNAGETVRLYNNSGRVMDQVEYADRGNWPAGPDGSGASLAKVDPDGGTQYASNW